MKELFTLYYHRRILFTDFFSQSLKISCRTLMRQLLHLCSSVNSPHPYSNCYQEYTCYAAH